jgi:hypothetical protein
MPIEAELVADALKPSGSRVARRNWLIKRALAAEFGYSNVSVKGGRGTGYGWVHIRIKVKRPHGGECDWRCHLCNEVRSKTEQKVWEIIKNTGLDEDIFTYYDDMGDKHEECTITVELTQ